MSESSSSSVSTQDVPTTTVAAASEDSTPSSGIEDLLRQLHGQIKATDWLEKNTADTFQEQNPDLVKAWKDAIVSESTQQQ